MSSDNYRDKNSFHKNQAEKKAAKRQLFYIWFRQISPDNYFPLQQNGSHK